MHAVLDARCVSMAVPDVSMPYRVMSYDGSQVNQQLPPKYEFVIFVRLSDVQKALYKVSNGWEACDAGHVGM